MAKSRWDEIAEQAIDAAEHTPHDGLDDLFNGLCDIRDAIQTRIDQVHNEIRAAFRSTS